MAGGVIIVPLLIWFFQFSQLQASGTSLTAMLLPLGAIAGVYQYFKNGLIGVSELKLGFLVAIGMFLGAYLGAKVALQLNVVVLKRGFAFVLVLSAIQLWFFDKK